MTLTTQQKRQYSLVSGLLAIVGLLLLVRIIVVAWWPSLFGIDLPDSLARNITLTILGDIIIIGIAASAAVIMQRQESYRISSERIRSWLLYYTFASIGLLVFAAGAPNLLIVNTTQSFLENIITHLIAAGMYTVSVGLAALMVMILLSRRHNNTRSLLIAQLVLAIAIWITSTLDSFSDMFGIVRALCWIASAVVMLVNIRRLNWVTTIPFNIKINLLLLSFAAFGFSGVFLFANRTAEDSNLVLTVSTFVNAGWVVPRIIMFLAVIFFGRLIMALLVSLPNSSIVDKRSKEVHALSTLTKLIADSADMNGLLQSATNHAMNICKAHGAWCEVYEGNGILFVKSQNIRTELVDTLRSHQNIHALCTAYRDPILIDSIEQSLGVKTAQYGVSSIVTIPLMSHNERLGTLVVLHQIEYGFDAEDVEVLKAVGDTIAVAIDQARLVRSVIEKERMQREFDVAREIQASLLPRTSPSTARIEMDAVMLPANEVGGDYYDYIKFNSGTLGVIIADVAGKGVPAALYMATLKGVVLAESRSATGPADLLQRINTTLYGSVNKRAYITIACIEVQVETGTLRIARAGHTPILVRHNGITTTYTPPGMAIGIAPVQVFNSALKELSVDVAAGDVCLLTTDGVNERRNIQMTEIGFPAIASMLDNSSADEARAIVHETLNMLDEYGAGVDAHDDVTIVAVQIKHERTVII